jgi:hypothetical protein
MAPTNSIAAPSISLRLGSSFQASGSAKMLAGLRAQRAAGTSSVNVTDNVNGNVSVQRLIRPNSASTEPSSLQREDSPRSTSRSVSTPIAQLRN